VNQRNFIDCLALKITALYPNDIFYVRVVPEPCFPGDFNFDGDSDGNDFLKWQRGESLSSLSQSDLADWEANFGTNNAPVQPGDFDGNSQVDGGDFLMWQRDSSIGSLDTWEANYSMVSAHSTISAAVPEPATGIMLLIGIAMTLTGRRLVVPKLNSA
jgi:hypothetical protein